MRKRQYFDRVTTTKLLHQSLEHLLLAMSVIRSTVKLLLQRELVVWLHWKLRRGWERILVTRYYVVMFQNLKSIPLDEVFRLFAEYNTDTREYKVNLGIGLCHDKDGKLYQLQSVKKAYKNVNVDDFSYAPI
jgi:hypothetical protein